MHSPTFINIIAWYSRYETTGRDSSKPDDLIAAALPHQEAEVSPCYVVQKPDFCFGKYMIEAIGAVISVDQPQLPPKCLNYAWLRVGKVTSILSFLKFGYGFESNSVICSSYKDKIFI